MNPKQILTCVHSPCANPRPCYAALVTNHFLRKKKCATSSNDHRTESVHRDSKLAPKKIMLAWIQGIRVHLTYIR